MNLRDELDTHGMHLLAQARRHPENRDVSPEAARLAGFTGLIGRDIDTFIRFTRMHELLIIARLPDFYAHAYVDEMKRGEVLPKGAHIKDKKTGTYGTLTDDGQRYVSDIDLMCAHRFDRDRQCFVPLVFEWDGQRAMTPEEERYFGALNNLLISRLQHGCNDNYMVGGRPGNTEIGTEFIAFDRGRTEVIYQVAKLRMYYNKHRLQNWQAAYRGS